MDPHSLLSPWHRVRRPLAAALALFSLCQAGTALAQSGPGQPPGGGAAPQHGPGPGGPAAGGGNNGAMHHGGGPGGPGWSGGGAPQHGGAPNGAGPQSGAGPGGRDHGGPPSMPQGGWHGGAPSAYGRGDHGPDRPHEGGPQHAGPGPRPGYDPNWSAPHGWPDHGRPGFHDGRPPLARPGSYAFRERDRVWLRERYGPALRGIDPYRRPEFRPGWAIPGPYRGYIEPLPPEVVYELPPPPPGYALGYYDGYAVVYDPYDYVILSVIDLLAY